VSEREPLDTFLSRIPEPAEVRQRIAENLRERQLLRHVLKLAEERRAAEHREGVSRAE
jgi:hypothetical protein